MWGLTVAKRAKRSWSLALALACTAVPLAGGAEDTSVVETKGGVRFPLPTGFTRADVDAPAGKEGAFAAVFERASDDGVVSLIVTTIPEDDPRCTLAGLPGESGPAPARVVRDFVAGIEDASRGTLADLKPLPLLYDNDRKAYGLELEGNQALGAPEARMPFLHRYAVIHTKRVTTLLRLESDPSDRPLLEAAWAELWNGFSIVPEAAMPRGIFSRLAFRQTDTAYLMGLFTGALVSGLVGGLLLGALVSFLRVRTVPGAVVIHVLASAIYLSLQHQLVHDGSLTANGLVRGATCLVALPLTLLVPTWRRRRQRPS
jgi:hypothetical protein